MTPEERFWPKVNKDGPGGCWIWTACTLPEGYGQFSYDGRVQGAHRVSYQFRYGQIPHGRVLDHLCRNPSCVNPEHLEAVTSWENVLRGRPTPATINAAKTHCLRGHEFTAANTYHRPGGSRVCRTCKNAAQRVGP